MQFVSGTHAISSALFGVLRPGDNFLSLTGRPYDTLEEVIGLRGKGRVEILSGINEGDLIVAEGLKKVRPRGKIKPIKN